MKQKNLPSNCRNPYLWKGSEQTAAKSTLPLAATAGEHLFTASFFRLAVLPLFLFIAALILEYTGADLRWEARFYAPLSQDWPYRDHWFFSGILHDGGRQLLFCVAGLWLAFFTTAIFHPSFKRFRRPLLFFLAATAAGPLIVGGLKQVTHIYTPWDIRPFSGKLPYVRLLDPVPKGLPPGGGFPAGHASGGYAFVSLYFLLDLLGAARKWPGLVTGLVMGGIYGIGQQVRGAHFPSHDLFALAICWYAALLIYYLFYPAQWRQLIHE